MQAKYSIDTSALLDAWDRWYPPDRFPCVWGHMHMAVENGVVVASDEVESELERKDDEILQWIKSHPEIIVELDEVIQQHVSEIMADFEKLVDERTGKSMADPFVIAIAKVHNLVVVTGEDGGTAKRPKIPYVCDHYGIRCINIVQLFREEKWVFA